MTGSDWYCQLDQNDPFCQDLSWLHACSRCSDPVAAPQRSRGAYTAKKLREWELVVVGDRVCQLGPCRKRLLPWTLGEQDCGFRKECVCVCV